MVLRRYFSIIDESKWYEDRSFYKYRLSILEEYYLQIRQERRKCVIDLYFNQHKTYAEIAEIEESHPVIYMLS